MSFPTSRVSLILLLSAALLAGCSGGTSTTSQSIQQQVTNLVAQSQTAIPSPTELPTFTNSPTSSPTSIGTITQTNSPQASASLTPSATSPAPVAHVTQNTNCRVGPGLQYINLYVAMAGTDLTIVDATTLNNYVVVAIPSSPGETCWLLTKYVTVNGSLTGLPIVTPPPTPTPTPTNTPTFTFTPSMTPTVTNTPTPTLIPTT